jgi:WD40 repeat protein
MQAAQRSARGAGAGACRTMIPTLTRGEPPMDQASAHDDEPIAARPRLAVPKGEESKLAADAVVRGAGAPALGATKSDREHEPVTHLGPAAAAAVDGGSESDDRRVATEIGLAAQTIAGDPESAASHKGPGAVLGARPISGGLSVAASSPRSDDTLPFAGPTIPIEVRADGAARPVPAIAGYEIMGELGRGGMGVVYHARQTRLNRPCALKMILAGAHAVAEEASRFLREAEAIARLQHPNIVQIHHIGEADGLPFFELEYVDGGGLVQQLDGTPWTPERAARLIGTLAGAMAVVHRLGIVHRDLKPANILLAADGTPKIVDFGLAKALGTESGLTQSESVMGSPQYMAPEQACGWTKRAGPPADVYALGAIFYELLTGRPPFRGATMLETLEQVKTVDPVPPSRLVPRLPRDVETVCLKCLQKEPARRYSDAAALADDLGRYAAGLPVRARRVGEAERAWRWCRRNPVTAGLVGGIALALVVGTTVATHFAVRAARGERSAVLNAEQALAHARRADSEARRAQEEKRLSDRRLYVAEMNLAHQAWQNGATGLVQQHLRTHEPKSAGNPDLRSFEWYYLDRLCQSAITLNGGVCVAYSPDGRTLASGSRDGGIALWDAVTGRERDTLRGHTAGVYAVTFSPDGCHLASAGDDGTIKVWDVASRRCEHTFRGHAEPVHRLAYSRDGRRLASAGADQTVRLWDTSTGEQIFTFRGHTAMVYGLAYSPDGRVVASSADDGLVKVWDAVTGRELHNLRGHSGPVRWLAFAPDGGRLASAGFDRTVKLWDVAAGHVVLTLRGHTDRVDGLAYSRDGRSLASGGWDQTVRVWDAATGQELLNLRGHTAWIWGVAFSPDGRQIAAAGSDQLVKLWDISTDQEAMTLRGHAGSIHRLAFSPDGQTLASASRDHTVRLWDVATGEAILILRGHADGVGGVAFSPDGRTVASGGGDRTVRIWDTSTGRELRVLRGHTAEVYGVAFAPGGRTLASCSADQTVRIWDTATGVELRTLRGHGSLVWTVVFSPDGGTLASASRDQTVRIWDSATGEELRTLSGHVSEVFAVAYSPDGRTVASAGLDQTVRLWDTGTGTELQSLRGHSSWVCRLAFSPDGQRLVSAGRDQAVRLWDTSTGQGVLTLNGHAGWLDGVAFAPDGRTVAAAGWDGIIKLWEATPLDPKRQVLREARSLLDFLLARSLPLPAVLERIRKDATIREPVRRRALELADAHRRSLVVREAERLVDALYARALFRPQVQECLRGDASLSEPVRHQALVLAELVPENAESLNGSSWGVASRPGGDPAAYRVALEQADVACRLIPQHGFFLTTLGIAQYRVGEYAASVATLARAEQLKAVHPVAPYPHDLAFLALGQHRLGRRDQARAALCRLREAMKRPEWARNPEALAFLREAGALGLDPAFPGSPFSF